MTTTEKRGGRRWPPHDKLKPRTDPVNEPALFIERMETITANWARVLQELAPTAVLGESLYQLDLSGIAAEQYRAPFFALHVTSLSAYPLTLAAMPRQTSAPGLGPGVSVIPPYGSLTVNMQGTVWSVYGGLPGDQLTVQALSRPMPPGTSVGTFAPAVLAYSVPAPGVALTASGQSPVINASMFSSLSLQAAVVAAPTGTTPSMTVSIVGLDPAGNQYPLATSGAITTQSNNQLDAGLATSNNKIIPAQVRVVWTLTGTTPSFLTELFLWGRE